MTANADPTAATPILDSAVQGKMKRKNLAGTLFGLLLGIPFGIALIASSNGALEARNPAADYILLIYISAIVSAIVAHELGHLLAGWLVGFRFNSITIGPVSLRLEYGRLKLQIRRALPAGGYAGMHVNRIRRLRRRLLIFIAAGPAANLLSAAVVATFLARVPKTSWLSVAGAIFWMISAVLGIANLLPFRLGVLYPDGARMAMLLTSRAKTRRWMSICAIGCQSQAGVRPRQFKRTWLEAAGAVRDGSIDDFAGNWVAYVAANDRKDTPVAAFHLERCLELVNLLGPSLRDLVALEAAVFTAWFRGNAAIAQKWMGQIKRLKAQSQLMRMRAEIALCCARQEFGPALTQWENVVSFIQKLPPTPVKNKLLEGFIEWRDEIRERQRSQLVPQPSALRRPSAVASLQP